MVGIRNPNENLFCMLKSEIIEHSINEKLGLYEDGHYNMSKSKEKQIYLFFILEIKLIQSFIWLT